MPPCGATGWNIESPDLKGVFDSMLSAGKKPLIRLGRKYRVIADADWFVLCGEISTGRSHSEPFAIGDGSHLPANGLKPPATGELVLFSNDLSSRIDFIDKYDNNAGWLVAEVERLS